jgi:hypothetical protein
MEFGELNEFANTKSFRYLMLRASVGIAVPNAGNSTQEIDARIG